MSKEKAEEPAEKPAEKSVEETVEEPTEKPTEEKLEKKVEKAKKKKKGVFFHYKVEKEGLKRLLPFCERCGPGYFMADHGNRYTCGHCGFTRYKQVETGS
jgi:small subunit ribosomal protein S27Ae